MSAIDHQLLMALMETITDRIYLKDRQGRFLFVNKAMLKFLKVENEQEVLGKTDFDFFLPIHADDAYADEQKVLATGDPIVAKVEQEIVPDGGVTWVSTTKVPLTDEHGKVIGTCGISRDVTAEHHKTEKIEMYARKLAEKQEQTEKEMVLARQIQLALLPQSYPTIPPGASEENSALKFAHRYLPSGQVGGDFFTLLPLSSTQVGVLVCDVMGHGVHAALITAVQRVLADDLLPLAGDPGVFLAELNRRLYQIFQRVQTLVFVTGLYMVIDLETGRLRFANAGHPHPLHLSRATNCVRVVGGSHQPSAFALGVLEGSTYVTLEDVVKADEGLLLFTDGLCDTDGDDQLNRDDPRFLSMVQDCLGKRGGAFLDGVLAKMQEFAGQANFVDDVCVVTVEIERLLTPL